MGAYSLKTAKARQFISEVNRRFPALLEEYPVLKEREREFIAQFKFTLLLLPGGTKKITGLPLGSMEAQVVSSHSVQDEALKKLLASSANPKKQRKKKAAGSKEAKEGEVTEDKTQSIEQN